MKKIVFLLTFVMAFSFKNVNAIEKCTSSEMSRLNELANNLEFKVNNKINYVDEEYLEVGTLSDIQILNYSSDLKIFYNSDVYDEMLELNSNNLVIDDLGEGETISIYIYAYVDNLCTNKLLKKEVIDIPVYNDYYYFNSNKCKEYPNFKYCQEFLDVTDKNFEDIDNEFKKIAGENKVDLVIEMDDYNNYLLIGIIALILVILIICIIIKKYKHKDEI